MIAVQAFGNWLAFTTGCSILQEHDHHLHFSPVSNQKNTIGKLDLLSDHVVRFTTAVICLTTAMTDIRPDSSVSYDGNSDTSCG